MSSTPKTTTSAASNTTNTVNEKELLQAELKLRDDLQQLSRGEWKTLTDFETQWCLFENYAKKSGLPDTKTIDRLLPILPMRIQEAWFKSTAGANTLVAAKEKLMKITGLDHIDLLAESLYRDRKQKPNEPVSDFYRELYMLFTRAGKIDDPGGRILLARDFEDRLLEKIKWPVMRRRTGTEKDKDPEEILRRALEEEEILRQSRRTIKNEEEITIQNIKTVTCYKCGKIGHVKRECKSKEFKCFVCGEAGHVKRDCPKQEQGNGQRTFRTGTNRSGKWYVKRKDNATVSETTRK